MTKTIRHLKTINAEQGSTILRTNLMLYRKRFEDSCQGYLQDEDNPNASRFSLLQPKSIKALIPNGNISRSGAWPVEIQQLAS